MKFFSFDHLIITILVFISMWFFSTVLSFELLDPFWQAFSDFRITDVNLNKLKSEDKSRADTRIILINTNKNDNLELARLISVINRDEPKVIGIEFGINTSGDPQTDNILRMVLGGVDNLIVAQEFGNWNEKKQEFTTCKKSGDNFSELNHHFDNLLIGQDKKTTTVRQFSPTSEYRGQKDTLFSLKIAGAYSKKAMNEFFKRNNDKETIFYKGNYEKFFFANSIDIINGEINIDFKNKIVLLGSVQPIGESFVLEDIYFTPLNDAGSGSAFPDMYGLVIHANIISMILNRDYFSYLPDFAAFLIAFIICYINIAIYSYICYYKKDLYEIGSLIIFVVESIVILIATVYLHHKYNFEAELTIAIYASALSGYAYEGYLYSMKPLIQNVYYKFSRKGVK